MTDEEVIRTLKKLAKGFLVWKDDEIALERAIEVMEEYVKNKQIPTDTDLNDIEPIGLYE